MQSTWLTKEIFKKALEERRVYLTTKITTSRNDIIGYNVYILDIGELDIGLSYRPSPVQMLHVMGHSPLWSDSKECYHTTIWSTSRSKKIILSIGENLGLKSSEILQTHQMI